MCGITAYVGSNQGLNATLCSLKKLEYRGYDSAGIAYFDDEGLKVVKSVGQIRLLEEKICSKKIITHCIMGHTRWATHGKANEENAHPHLSQNGFVCVIHNGIIENAESLKKELKDVDFHSQTDTEVFANLLEKELNGNTQTENVLNCLKNIIKKLKGSFAFGIMIKGVFDKIFFVKQKSPLVLGREKDFCMFCSDQRALDSEAQKVAFLSDGDYGYIQNDSFIIFNKGKEVKRKEFLLDYKERCQNKDGCTYFMEKEIKEGKFSVFNTLLHLESVNLKSLVKKIRSAQNIFVVGCGTALHAGEVFKFILERDLKLFVSLDYASEFRYKKPNINKNSLCIFISQSGETADTLASAILAKRKGAKCIAITNVYESRITKICDEVLNTHAGVEVSVASTKAYIAQLAALYFLVSLFAKIYDKKIEFSVKNMLNLCKIDDYGYKNAEIEHVSNIIKNEKSLFFVGRGIDYFVAKEGALKLKEITYVHCEAFAGGELKHGSLSLVDDKSFVVCILTQKNLLEKMMSNIIEMKSRGAKIILFSPFEELRDKVFLFIKLKKVKSSLMPFVAIKPLQELALFTAIKRGLNPDMPRNLAKSVTVE